MSYPTANPSVPNVHPNIVGETTSSDVGSSEAGCSDYVNVSNASQDRSLINQQVMEEYVTQFFGFTPRAFCDSIYNALFDSLHDGVDTFQKLLLSEFKDIVTEEDLCLSSKKILEAIIPNAEKSCEKLELYLKKNIFFIPKGMLFPEDEVHRTVCTVNDEKLLDHELETLEKEILNGRYMIHTLQQQQVETDAAIAEYSKVYSLLEKIEKLYADQGISNLADIKLVNCKVPELVKAVEDIDSYS